LTTLEDLAAHVLHDDAWADLNRHLDHHVTVGLQQTLTGIVESLPLGQGQVLEDRHAGDYGE
jgi:hypothetical protein